jgi:hypothetical protein
MTYPGTTVHVAKKEYRCADCPRPIAPSDEYVPVNEYGEQLQLHRACAELRASRRPARGQRRTAR